MSTRYLIIGASGFIGTRLRTILGPAGAVATYNSHPFDGGFTFDAIRDRLSDRILRCNAGLTHALILHGITNIDACAKDPAGTKRINVDSIRNIVDELADHGIQPVFFSSDAVFDGTRGMWTEEDDARPILTYGRHKLEVENYLLDQGRPHITVRMSKVLTAIAGGGDMLDQWMNLLEEGGEIRCARDQVFSPVDVDDAINAILRLIESGRTGLFHVCCPRPVSRLGLLNMLAEEVATFRDISAKIRPCSIRDFDFAETRPLDTSMSPAKLYATLGRPFDDLREVCKQAVARRYAARMPN